MSGILRSQSSKMRPFLGILVLLLAAPCIMAQATSLASTPPMGWNSWNHFHRNIDDATVRAQADAMVSSGMRDAGYVYINIDDTWEGERDEGRAISRGRP
jgi:alpha-galactosidase